MKPNLAYCFTQVLWLVMNFLLHFLFYIQFARELELLFQVNCIEMSFFTKALSFRCSAIFFFIQGFGI